MAPNDEIPRQIAAELDGKGPLVVIPEVCKKHSTAMLQRLNVLTLVYAHYFTLNVLLFRRLIDRPETQASYPDPQSLNVALQHIGCLACASESDFEDCLAVMKQGLKFAAQVAQANTPFPERIT